MTTPLDLIYTQLILDVKADSVLGAQLKDRNVIAYTKDTSPEKNNYVTSDLPELTVFMRAIRGNIHASSSHSHLTTVWRFQAVSSGYDSAKIHGLLFSTLRVLTRWKSGAAGLLWKSRPFVKDVRIVTGDQGLLSNPTNISGWAVLLDAEIDISFLTSDLLAND